MLKPLQVLILISIVLTSFCFLNKKVNQEEFYAYYRKHIQNYTSKIKAAEFEYQVLYKPFQIQLIEYIENEKPKKVEIKNFTKENKNNLDFILKLSIPQFGQIEFLKYKKGKRSFEEKIIYYSFDFKKDICLILDSIDTIRPQYYNFERGFDILPSGEFYLSFQLPNKKFSIAKLHIVDKGFEQNNLEFPFTNKNLFSFPKLKKYKKWS